MMGVFVPNVRDRAAFRPERFNPVVLAERERTKAILACFEPGQFIPVHRPGMDLTAFPAAGCCPAWMSWKPPRCTPRTAWRWWWTPLCP